jgi:enoyl-CoA hydratase
MSDESPLVQLDLAAAVATITLNSPANRNALSHRLVAELRSCLEAAAADTDVHVVVLTHTGTTFSSGADLAEAASGDMRRGTRALLELLRAVVELPLPVVAVVRGHARAGGVGLVGACDVALATENSTFAFTEVRLGLAPAIISLTTLPRLTSRDAARKYLTGSTFDGAEAARAGLVTAAEHEERLDSSLEELLATFGTFPRQGLTETKRLLNARLLQQFSDSGESLVDLSARLFASAATQDAIAAFRSRRS